jgi:GABA(A) receptor-associated protein
MTFKNRTLFNDRITESCRIIAKYPNRIPIICEQSTTSENNYPKIDKNKFLVPYDFTIGQFLLMIRKRMKLPPEKALFLFVNGNIYNSTQYLCNIYETQKDDDGFLYIIYAFENTFGIILNNNDL